MAPLERSELLTLMDANTVAVYAADARATPGGVAEETPGLALCRTPRGTVSTNMAIVTGAIEVGAIRERVAAFYDGRPFSLWTREHADAELERALLGAGYHHFHLEPGMVFLPGAGPPVPPPPGITIEPVTNDRGRLAYAHVMSRAFALYGAPETSTAEHFERLPSLFAPDIQGYVAWRGERAVAGAMLYMAHGVGGIGWVGTLPDEFRRGHGRAVTWAAIAEGLRRGARFMNLQASPMGEPMYRAMGFMTPTHYRWFLPPA